jgi:hypothetical protein
MKNSRIHRKLVAALTSLSPGFICGLLMMVGLLLLCPTNSPAQGVPNPVVDPSFESGMFSGKSEVGDGWYVLGASADFVVTHEDNSAAEPAEGNYVLQVVAFPRPEAGEFRLAQKIPVEASAESRRFEVSLMVKTAPGFEGRLLVTGDGIKGVYVGGTDGQWREVVTEAEVPPDAENLYLAVYMNEGTGTIQLDDVRCMAR